MRAFIMRCLLPLTSRIFIRIRMQSGLAGPDRGRGSSDFEKTLDQDSLPPFFRTVLIILSSAF